MNGRALNDKAIEVSPSSSRVLDRAHDILCAFPPSKNRPRPGDWTCPSCGFSNFQRRTACFRCSYPAVSAGPTGDMGYGGGGGGYGGGGGGGFGGYGPPQMGPAHHGHGGHHGHMGHGGGRMGGGSGVVPFRAGDWKCGNEVCGYHNFAKNVCCLRCGASRHNAAVVADSGYSTPGMETPATSYMGSGSMAGTPGPGHFGAGGFGVGGGYGQQQQQQQYGPPSTYALPSGIGGGAAPYPGSLNTNYAPGHASHAAGVFDSRAEAAFNAGNGPASGGPSNGFYNPAERDAFSFLTTGMNEMTVNTQGQSGGGAPGAAGARGSPAI